MASGLGLIIEGARELTRKIIKFVKDAVNTRLFTRAPKIQINIRNLVAQAIRSQPEYKSLLGGKLQSELGVPDTEPRLDEIVDTVVNSIEVKINKVRESGDKIEGGLSISFNKDDLDRLLNSPIARYVTAKGETIEWLRWLLLEGDKLIVRNYMIGIDPKNYARTGLGEIMIPSGRKSAGWSVPPEFAGTAENNFITRALLSVSSQIDQAVLDGLSGN